MPFSFAFARLNALQAAVRHPHTEVGCDDKGGDEAVSVGMPSFVVGR